MSFLYDGSGTSPAAFQVTQETCKYFKFDLWDAGPTRFAAGQAPNADAVAVGLRRGGRGPTAGASDSTGPGTTTRAPRSTPQSFAGGMGREHHDRVRRRL